MPRSAVGAHGERSAQSFLGRSPTDGDGDDLRPVSALTQAQRLLDRDLVERVHRHLEIGEVDPGAIRLHPNLHIGIDHAFHRDEDLHLAAAPADVHCTQVHIAAHTRVH
jgi:hypothetical protein